MYFLVMRGDDLDSVWESEAEANEAASVEAGLQVVPVEATASSSRWSVTLPNGAVLSGEDAGDVVDLVVAHRG